MPLKKETFLQDFLAGLTTAFAALALGAAFGLQSGRGAFAGMISAGIIPIITSIFGGTRLQASGPTAPMTTVSVLVISYAYNTFGENSADAEGFVTLVLLLSGLIMILAGLLKLGKLITLIPNVVILGFMNGIAVLIWWDQIKKLFGLYGTTAISGLPWQNLIFALVTFILILVFPKLLAKVNIPEKIRPFIPGTLVVIISMTYLFLFVDLNLETVKLGNSVSSLSEFVELIEKYLPSSNLFTLENILRALPFALQLALLGYLDSLLTSLVIDKMTKETTPKNKELMAQGLANASVSLVGGIPGAQATIRSVILLKEGAKTRLAGILVGVFTLLGTFVFSQLVALVATSIFVGVLLKAGLDVFEKDFLSEYFRKKGYLDKTFNWQMFFVVYTTFITVIFDLNIAVFSGTILFYLAHKFLNLKDVQSESGEMSKNED